MKAILLRAALTISCPLTLAASLQAAATNKITVEFLPAAAGGIVANDGAGSYANGSSATVTALNTNDCYTFIAWTVGSRRVANNPYAFTVTKNETLAANFVQAAYHIYTSSSPANGGTTGGGGIKGCGTIATLTATAKPGFAFTDWTSSLGAAITNHPYLFTVGGDESFVAHFKDIKPPALTIIAPTASEKSGTAAFLIEGTASDNVGVASVFYNLNQAGWVLASNMDNFTPWYAFVTLKTNGANTVSAYAVDTSGNVSAAKTVTFTCAARGYAPLSIAGQLSDVYSGTNAYVSFIESFDSAAYVRNSANTNDGGEVGTYTYTPTGPNTAELVPRRVLPTPDAGAGATVLELTFTDAYSAAYASASGGNGFFYFAASEQSVPATLDGAVAVRMSFVNSNGFSTNSFGSATFTEEDGSGGSHSGTYTFTQFTPVAALLAETYTSPSAQAGTTDYIVLTFTEGASPPSGIYYSENGDAAGPSGSDVGAFSLSTNSVTTKFWGPSTLAGLQAAVTPAGAASFTRSYGNGTFASTSLVSTEPVDVGLVLANTRVTTKTGVAAFLGLAPPYIDGLDNETVDLTWQNAAGTKAMLTVDGTGETAKITYSKAGNFVPPALSGRKIMVTQTEGQKRSAFAFTYNNFIASGNVAGSGTYTYAPYTPTMALVQVTWTNGAYAGEVQYALLTWQSPASGIYVNSKQVNSPANNPANWEFESGSFSMSSNN